MDGRRVSFGVNNRWVRNLKVKVSRNEGMNVKTEVGVEVNVKQMRSHPWLGVSP